MATDERLATGTLTVTIEESCVTEIKDIKVELDDELNNDVTCFTPGMDFYVRIYPQPSPMNIVVRNTNGVARPNPKGKIKISEHEEFIVVTDGIGNVIYPVDSIVSVVWHGAAPCPIPDLTLGFKKGYTEFNCEIGECVGSPIEDPEGSCNITWGVLKVNYKSRYHSYIANAISEGPIVISAYEDKD